eukprot:jgi/Galph1/5292/GphlegSOOS_G3998.1
MNEPGTAEKSSYEKRFYSLLENGSYYDAEQLCTARHYRFHRLGMKQEAFSCLLTGSKDLARVKNSQEALVLLEKATEYLLKNCMSEENVSELLTVFDMLPTFPNKKSLWISKLLQLYERQPASEELLQKLHNTAIHIFIEEENYRLALFHCNKIKDSVRYSEVLQQWMNKGLPSEQDMFVTREVLRLLLEGKKKMALDAFTGCLRSNQSLDSYPLIGFLKLLFQCIDLGRTSLIGTLCTIYKPSFDRDQRLWNLALQFKQNHHNL